MYQGKKEKKESEKENSTATLDSALRTNWELGVLALLFSQSSLFLPLS